MSDTPTILGISMAPQKNRRLLVTTTYVILVACMAATPFAPFRGSKVQAAWGVLFFVAYIMGNHFLFGSMVRPFMVANLRKEEELLAFALRQDAASRTSVNWPCETRRTTKRSVSRRYMGPWFG